MGKYTEYCGLNLSNIGKEMQKYWEDHDVFAQSLKQREGAESFVFFEGPPSANGKPGIHHVLARSLKDIVCRYQTLKGKYVGRKGGWDTHGLPVELGVEKALGITKENIGKTITAFSQDDIRAIEKNGSAVLNIDGQEVTIDVTDVEIVAEDIPGWVVANQDALTVALDIELTEDLLNEGYAREFVNRIQNYRKDSNMDVSDRITIEVESHPQLDKAFTTFADYIKTETLCTSLEIKANVEGEVFEITEGLNVKVKISKNDN
jgi:isoleucyl-tRNA synthetase